MSALSTHVLAFNDACRKMHNTEPPTPYFTNGTYFYIRRKVPPGRAKRIEVDVWEDYECRACSKRFLFLASLFGQGNEPVFDITPFNAVATDLYNCMATRLRGYCNEFAAGEICGIYVLSDVDVPNIGGFHLESGIGPSGTAFHHFSAQAPALHHTEKTIPDDHLYRTFYLYIINGKALHMFNQLRARYVFGYELNNMRDILAKEPYGTDFLPAIDWMIKLYKSIDSEKVPIEVHMLDALASGGILLCDEDVVVPIFHTALRLFDILKMASYRYPTPLEDIMKNALLGPQ